MTGSLADQAAVGRIPGGSAREEAAIEDGAGQPTQALRRFRCSMWQVKRSRTWVGCPTPGLMAAALRAETLVTFQQQLDLRASTQSDGIGSPRGPGAVACSAWLQETCSKWLAIKTPPQIQDARHSAPHAAT